jgi:hypothetical protein
MVTQTAFRLNFLAVSFASRFVRKKLRSNVWHNTALGDDDIPQELAQSVISTRREISTTDVRHRDSLFIVSDGKLKVSRYNATFLVIARGVAGELEDFRSQVLQYGSEVDLYI